MKFKRLQWIIAFGSILLFGNCSKNPEIAQWRGANRDGIYSDTGLLKVWPQNGPELLWSFEETGKGYGSPVVTSKGIFVCGTVDSTGHLFALDFDGKLLWKSGFGPEWTVNFPGPRCTPSFYDGLVYTVSGMGRISCFDASNGSVVWSKEMLKDLHGTNIRFGYTESLAVDEEKVYCVPGGKDTNIVALDRFNGNLIWTSKGTGEMGAYCSPLLLSLQNRKIMVTFTWHSLVAVDCSDGKVLWTHLQKGNGDIHCNTPVYDNGYLYYSTGAGNGGVKLQLTHNGDSIKEIWQNEKFDNVMGGFVKIHEYLYGSGYRKRVWKAVDCNSGQIADTLAFDIGSTIFANGMLYAYNEKGMAGLIKPNKDKLELISSFPINKGTDEHFAHPVIGKGMLLIRHGNALMAYKITK